jgi:hypothetical protein
MRAYGRVAKDKEMIADAARSACAPSGARGR